MADNRDQFFDQLAGFELRPADRKGHSDDTEFTLVKKMLQAADCYDRLAAVRSAARQSGLRVPTAAWFCVESATPVWVGYRQVPYQKAALTDMINRFSKTPCFAAWESLADTSLSPELATACAFRWPGWGDCVIHNWTGDLPTDGTFFAHHHNRQRFVIEPVIGFLGRLNWRSTASRWREGG